MIEHRKEFCHYKDHEDKIVACTSLITFFPRDDCEIGLEDFAVNMVSDVLFMYLFQNTYAEYMAKYFPKLQGACYELGKIRFKDQQDLIWLHYAFSRFYIKQDGDGAIKKRVGTFLFAPWTYEPLDFITEFYRKNKLTPRDTWGLPSHEQMKRARLI